MADAYTHPLGWNDAVNFPTKPTTETQTRALLQEQHDQILTFHNNHMADKAPHKGYVANTTIANLNYFVSTTGLDTNDGLTSGTAFKTIQHTLDILPQIINHTITIYIADGAYAEDVVVAGFAGKGQIIANGNVATPANVTISSINISQNSCYIFLQGFTATSITKDGITVKNNTYVQVKVISCIAATATYAGISIQNSNTWISTCTISNRSAGIDASGPCAVTSELNSGTGNTIGLKASYTATIGKAGGQPAGTTAESATYGGIIR